MATDAGMRVGILRLRGCSAWLPSSHSAQDDTAKSGD